MSTSIETEPQTAIAVWKMVLIGVWLLLLVPCILLIPLSFMAFDSGDSLHARFFVLSVCTYPVAVAIAVLLRKAQAAFLFLPCVNLLVFVVSGSFK